MNATTAAARATQTDQQAQLFAAWSTARGLVVQLARKLTESPAAVLLVDLTGALKAEELARAEFARSVESA